MELSLLSEYFFHSKTRSPSFNSLNEWKFSRLHLASICVTANRTLYRTLSSTHAFHLLKESQVNQKKKKKNKKTIFFSLKTTKQQLHSDLIHVQLSHFITLQNMRSPLFLLGCASLKSLNHSNLQLVINTHFLLRIFQETHSKEGEGGHIYKERT